MIKAIDIEIIKKNLPKDYELLYRIESKNVFIVKRESRKYIIKFIDIHQCDIEHLEMMLKLEHKGICNLVEYKQVENYYMLTCDYIEGISLYEHIQENGVMDEMDMSSLVVQLAETLNYMHCHPKTIIHRDINPKNIIISKSGPVIIDLDTSRSFDRDKSTDTVAIGVIGFIAPEQYGFSQSTIRSDVYSLGVVAAYCLTGKYPKFNNHELMLVNCKVSKYTMSGLKKMTAFSPKDRPQTMKQVIKIIKKSNNRLKSLLLPTAIISIILLSTLANETRKIKHRYPEGVDDNS